MKKYGMLMMMGAVLCIASALAPAGARAADRDTPERTGDYLTATAGEDLDAGTLAGVWTNGQAYAATVSKQLTVVGRVEKPVASGGTALLKRGVFRWANGNSSVAAKDIGATCYVYTNTAYTVDLSVPASGCTNTAGKVFAVDTSGVWVRSGF